jgi:hypothetical protein
MCEQIQTRLRELKKEFTTGQGRLQELERQQVHLRETMLRVSGAIQVLEELLADGGSVEQNDANAGEQQPLSSQVNPGNVIIKANETDVLGISATVNVETSDILKLERPPVGGVKNANSAGFFVGAFEPGISGRSQLDINVAGMPGPNNSFGGIPDVTVMSLLGNGGVGIGTTNPIPENVLEVQTADSRTAVSGYSHSGIGVGGTSDANIAVRGDVTSKDWPAVFGANGQGVGVAGEPEVVPPGADRVRGELGGVGADANADPPLVQRDVVDPIRGSLPARVGGEVVRVDLDRLPLGRPFSPVVLELADQLPLLRIHRYDRLLGGQRGGDGVVDVVKLRVAIGMLGPLPGLAVALHREPHPVQQPQHRPIDDLMTQPAQITREPRRALGRPAHRHPLRIADSDRLKQAIQRLLHPRITLEHRRPARARSTDPPGLPLLTSIQAPQPPADRRLRHPSHSAHRRKATTDRASAPPTPPTTASGAHPNSPSSLPTAERSRLRQPCRPVRHYATSPSPDLIAN